jgi:signal transduction histidine kinase
VKTVPASVLLVSHLQRGSVVVWSWTGVVGAVLMTAALAMAVFVALEQQDSEARARQQLQSEGRLLSSIAGPLLDEGRSGDARLMLSEFAEERKLQLCRIVGADGIVLAQSMSTPAPAGSYRVASVAVPMKVRGAAAEIELASPVEMRPLAAGRGQMAAGVMFIGGLVLAAYAAGSLRRRVRPLCAIGDALMSLAAGEQAGDALCVDARFGPEAEAWNTLLGDREKLRQELLSERARESLMSRGDGRGDLGQACDALWQGMVLVDEHLRIKYANGAAAVFLRSRKEAMISGTITDVLSDPEITDAIRGVAGGSVRRRTTHEVRRPDEQGGGVLRFSIRPVRREDAAAALVIIEDITQQRIADEARNAFVAQVTHELRTPLTNIRLYVEQAIEDGGNDPQCTARALNVINQESRRLERIVGDMLSVAEIEAGSFRLRNAEVRLETLFAEIEEDYRPQAKAKNIELEFNLPPKLPAICGDRDKIVLAMHNLLGNAIKYTPDGGKVTVRVEVEDSRLIVDVVDTGIGINPEETELIFEKFYRARDKRVGSVTGTGLGLALAREVVRLHGGDLSVRSQIDRGSTFTMTIPTVQMAA